MTDNQTKPYAPVTAPDARSGGFQVRTPLVLTADVWPEHETTDDASTPITGWQVEHSINGYSLGFDESRTEPDGDQITKMQKAIVIALRDLIAGVLEAD
jgi:hypothetical protein